MSNELPTKIFGIATKADKCFAKLVGEFPEKPVIGKFTEDIAEPKKKKLTEAYIENKINQKYKTELTRKTYREQFIKKLNDAVDADYVKQEKAYIKEMEKAETDFKKAEIHYNRSINSLKFKPHFAKIVVFGVTDNVSGQVDIHYLDEDSSGVDVKRLEAIAKNDRSKLVLHKVDEEIELINAMATVIFDRYNDLCSYNGIGFDLPVWLHRAMILGYENMQWQLYVDLRNRFKMRHFDISSELAGDLNYNAKVLLRKSRMNIDFKNGDINELINYVMYNLSSIKQLQHMMRSGA